MALVTDDFKSLSLLLIKDSNPYSIVSHLERALTMICNVVTIYLDIQNWMPKKIVKPIGRIHDSLWNIRARHLKQELREETDLILVVEPPIKRRLSLGRFNCKKAFYALDPHLNAFEQYVDAGILDYDYVFVSQKDYVHTYADGGCRNVSWLPYAAVPEIHRKYDLPLEYDLSFVGSLSKDRTSILHELKTEFKVFVGRAYLHELARQYSRSKIVFHKSSRGALNPRVFEALACGRLLIADRIRNGLTELFEENRHLVLYDGVDDLREKIRYYLENQPARERIAAEGQKEVYTRHSYLHRAMDLLGRVLA